MKIDMHALQPNTTERYTGSILGLAIGDALGAPVEFMQRDTFTPVSDYQIGGKFNVAIGEYTDDTAMALCLAQSLIEKQGMDPQDQLDKYVAWYQDGYMSATGRSIGCGKTVLLSLMRFMRIRCNECGNSRMKKGAGNGSLMRVAPVALFYAKDLQTAMEMAAISSYTTHGLKVCADACMMMTGLMVGALEGKEKKELLSESYAKYLLSLPSEVVSQEIEEIICGSYKLKSREEISSSGYVVSTLEAALWAFYHTDTFEEGVLLSVNLGHDADTVAAVYGQLAGAYYGVEGIPKHLRENLIHVKKIVITAKTLIVHIV